MKFRRAMLVFALIVAWPMRGVSIRLAILPDENARAAADLLTVELTARKDVVLLERAEVQRVYRELAIVGQQSAAGLKLGQVLGANGVLTVEEAKTGSARLLKMQLIAVGPGVILSTWTNDAKLALQGAWAAGIAGRIDRLLPKLLLLPREAVPVSVAHFRSAVAYRDSATLEGGFTSMFIERLTLEPRLFVLERRRMEMLVSEKNLVGGNTSDFWNGSFIIDGVLDPKAIDATTLSVSARVLPPRGGAPIVVETSGPRTNVAAVVQALTVAVMAKLNAGVAAAWTGREEAERFFEDAKWARRWGLLPDAQASAEASWALGKRGRDITELRIASYAEAAQTAPIWTHTKQGVVVEDDPVPERLSAITRALDLFAEASPLESNTNVAWCGLGVDLLELSSLLLQHYYFYTGRIDHAQNELAGLRGRCRDVVRWIESNPALRTNDWPRSGSLLNVNVWPRISSDRKNSSAMKSVFGAFWQESPEAASAMYLEMFTSPTAPVARAHLITRQFEDLRMPDWRTRLPNSDALLWPQFCRQLISSTDPSLRIHGKIFALNDLRTFDIKNHPEFLAAVSNLVLELESRRTEFLSRTMDPGLVQSAADVIISRCNQGNTTATNALIRATWWPRVRGILDTNTPAPIVIAPAEPPPVPRPAPLPELTNAVVVKLVRPTVQLSESDASIDDLRVTAWRLANGRLWTQVFFEEGLTGGSGVFKSNYVLRTGISVSDLRGGKGRYLDFEPPEPVMTPSDWDRARRYFEVNDGALYVMGSGEISRLDMEQRRIETFPVATDGNPVIHAVGEHLYFSSLDSILRYHKTTKDLTVLASTRRQPALSVLDQAGHLNYPSLLSGPSNSILAVVNGGLFQLSAADRWEQVTKIPITLIPSSSFSPDLLFKTPGGPADMGSRLVMLRADNSWRQVFGAPLAGFSPLRAKWTTLDTFTFIAFACDTNELWVLEKMQPLVSTHAAARLLHFNHFTDESDVLPLVFESSDKRFPTPFVTSPAETSLILTPEKILIVGRMQPGWWEISRREIEPRFGLDRKQVAGLAAKQEERREAIQASPDARLLSLLDKYDLNQDGGLDFLEMVEAIRGEKIFGRLQNLRGGSDARELIFPYDKNRDNRIDLAELREMIGKVNKPYDPSMPVTNAPVAMRAFDLNHDGIIDREEIRAYAASVRGTNGSSATNRVSAK